MKKKFLSLMMAAAVVATTSVSAFAADENQSYDVSDTNGRKVQIGITGNVTDNSGHVASGTVSVTVPTVATFKVDEKGKLTSPSMKITSNSSESVDVIATKFIDANGEDGINLVKQSDFTQQDTTERKKVWLKLVGDKEVSLTSESKGKMYTDNDTEITESNANGYVLGTVTQDLPLTLTLKGEGGTLSQNNTPIQNDFKLILKIKKSS